MKRLIPAAAALALAAPTLSAEVRAQDEKPAAHDISAAFGNTVLSTYPDGRKGKLWLKADGTYTAKGRRNLPSSGVWTLKGARICLKQRKPTPVPFAYCTTAPNGGVGTRWNAKAVTGEPIEVSLVKGVING